jgi:dTDP-4-amino-4,6-dideoxygalactose transaminase
MPFQVQEITAISQKYNIPILEDGAEAMGSSYYGVKCGTFGDIGVLSFNGNKIITTSGGGALITQSIEIKKKAIFLATQARDDAPFYQHSEIGYNYRLSNVLAGIGRGQMEVLDDRVAARRNNFKYYRNALQGIHGIEFLEEPKRFFSNRWLTCILTKNLEMREAIRLALTNENIECRPLWKPMHKQPIFSKCDSMVNGVSEDLFQRGLCLPSGSDLTEGDLQRITKIILKTAK